MLHLSSSLSLEVEAILGQGRTGERVCEWGVLVLEKTDRRRNRMEGVGGVLDVTERKDFVCRMSDV